MLKQSYAEHLAAEPDFRGRGFGKLQLQEILRSPDNGRPAPVEKEYEFRMD